jgi:ankyrin repeat protein
MDDNRKFLNAASWGDTKFVKLLIKKGVDINTKENDVMNAEQSAITYAACYGSTEIVKLLIEAGADINAKNNYGMTAFIYAAHSNNIEIAKLLIKAGVDINAKDKYGWSAFTFAARNGHTEIVKLLIEAGIDINAKDIYGRNALMYAEDNKHTEIVKLLIEKELNDKITALTNENKELKKLNQNMTNHFNYAASYSSGYLKAYKDFELHRNKITDDINQVDMKDLEDYSITINYKKDKNNLLYIETDDGFECVGPLTF